MKHNIDDKGFTLLEVTVATTIFLVGVLFVISLFPQGLRGIKNQEHRMAEGIVLYSVRRSVQQVIETSEDYFEDRFWEKNTSYEVSNPMLTEGLFKVDPYTQEGMSLFDFEYNIQISENHRSHLLQLILNDMSDFDYQKGYETRV